VTDEPWPLPTSAEQIVMDMICNRTRPSNGRGGVSRWAVVALLTGLGSTHATLLCRWVGLDPDEIVLMKR
jgi:hypothetical protein